MFNQGEQDKRKEEEKKRREVMITQVIDLLRKDEIAGICIFYDVITGEPSYIMNPTQWQQLMVFGGGNCVKMLEFALKSMKERYGKYMQEQYEKSMKVAEDDKIIN